MLQQTRVAAVLPYYDRFLSKYPTVNDLAAAPLEEVLALWSGLGYYSRARNLHAAARLIRERGNFPASYDAIRALPGVGDYTAAAVGSIAFGMPYVVVDGNVLRVMARLLGDPADIGSQITRQRIREKATRMLDPMRAGDFNQALMELGATVCVPRDPRCSRCPWSVECRANQRGIASQLPVKLRKQKQVEINRTVLVIERGASVLLRQRAGTDSLMPGFWELPEAEDLPEAEHLRLAGRFRHSITVHNYRFDVVESGIASKPAGYRWVNRKRLEEIPLSTIARKALHVSAQSLENV